MTFLEPLIIFAIAYLCLSGDIHFLKKREKKEQAVIVDQPVPAAPEKIE